MPKKLIVYLAQGSMMNILINIFLSYFLYDFSYAYLPCLCMYVCVLVGPCR